MSVIVLVSSYNCISIVIVLVSYKDYYICRNDFVPFSSLYNNFIVPTYLHKGRHTSFYSLSVLLS